MSFPIPWFKKLESQNSMLANVHTLGDTEALSHLVDGGNLGDKPMLVLLYNTICPPY